MHSGDGVHHTPLRKALEDMFRASARKTLPQVVVSRPDANILSMTSLLQVLHASVMRIYRRIRQLLKCKCSSPQRLCVGLQFATQASCLHSIGAAPVIVLFNEGSILCLRLRSFELSALEEWTQIYAILFQCSISSTLAWPDATNISFRCRWATCLILSTNLIVS